MGNIIIRVIILIRVIVLIRIEITFKTNFMVSVPIAPY